MLKWIARLIGDRSLDLPEGVPAVWAESAEAVLAPLDKVDGSKGRSGLAHDILSYVLHGEPLAILSEVAQRPEVGQGLALTSFNHSRDDRALAAVYEHFDSLPLPVALRWARFVEATASSQKGHCVIKMAGGAIWPELLLLNSTGTSINSWGGKRQEARFITATRMEALLVECGLPADALLVAAFGTPVKAGYITDQRLLMVTDLVGYSSALARHLDSLRPLLLTADAAQRQHVLNMLEKARDDTLDTLAPALCEMATGGSRPVRVGAEALLRRCGDAVFEPLRSLAREGKPDQRALALRLLHQFGSARQRPAWLDFAREAAAADKAASVQALLTEWDTAAATPASDPATLAFTLPVIDWTGATHAPGPGVLEAFWRDVDAAVAAANAQSREWHAQSVAKGHSWPLNLVPPVAGDDRQALADYLKSDRATAPRRDNRRRDTGQFVAPALLKRIEAGELTPVATLKLLQFFELLADDSGLQHPAQHAFKALHQRQGRPTLLELSLMLDSVGRAGTSLLRNYCTSWGVGFATDWPDADVWPYFAHHLDHVVTVLTQNSIQDYAFSRAGLFRALATLPAPPAAAINALFGVALGTAKADRAAAQEALKNLPGKEQRIAEALADGKGEVRTIAAHWLGRLRHAGSIPALERAVAKEKNDVAKGAMLDALQLMGQPVEKYLDRQALATDAAKSLAKGLPKELDGFPWEALPAVRWADNGQAVPREVQRWMLVQAVKQKSPEPNAVLRKYCAMFEPADREAFGQFVLETWLRDDTRPITPEDAMARARSTAQSTHNFMSSHPQYFQNDPNLGNSVEELTAVYLPGLLRQPTGSAIGAKGLLAVAGACCGARAAPPVQRYLKEWYGTRAAQGKALIAMLAWIDHPSATQLMLSIGSRFRTKSFQEEATKQAEALAERKGWTLAELADRTIPSAGFDETGTLELSFGLRVFTAKLLPDFKVELFNPEGKKISALPEPRQDDDAEQAKESKKAFSAAKKELKSIVELQTDRLYEALCTERDWPFADWADYLQCHPVLHHLVQRLVWVEVAEGVVQRSFRPLDDGTLTDLDDNEVTLAPEARVRLAHDSLLGAETVAAWQRHLADYEIKPLFQQLGKGVYELPADKAQQDEVKDFEGHLLEAFALRGRALKLGYTRGASEDGGWFYVYEKRFPTLGLQAAIEFSGNGLPEENRTVALHKLSFTSTAAGGDRWNRSQLPLKKVPKVLLSECYNDLRLIAAEGSGFDPEWRKKSEP